MKIKIFFIILTFIIINCVTQKNKETDTITKATEYTEIIKEKPRQIEIKKTGFRYQVPPNMEECPKEAYRYRFDNLIIDKGSNINTTTILIAIRHTDDYKDYSLLEFAKLDQLNLRNHVKIKYDGNWQPQGLKEKSIEFIPYQFTYLNGNDTIYQRSVYIRDKLRFYIISMSSKEKELLISEKNDFFWNSIYVD